MLLFSMFYSYILLYRPYFLGNINMIFHLYNRYAIFNPDGFFPLNEAKTKFSPLGVIICENLDLPDTENF